MTVIDKTNLIDAPFKVVRDILIANLTDPKNRYKKSLIHSKRFFSSSDVDFVGYPYVVVYPSGVTQAMETNDQSIAEENFLVRVEVLGSIDDLTSYDSLCSQIILTLNSDAVRETLRANNFKEIKIDAFDGVEEYEEGERISTREITITGKSVMTIR